MAWAIPRFFLCCGGDVGVGVEGEPLENSRSLRFPTAEKLKNCKIDCGCATSRKPRIAGLCEREGRACVHLSLSCSIIERADF